MKDLTGKITGDQLLATEWDDHAIELKNYVEKSGITLSDGDQSQMAKAGINYSSFGDYYSDSGAANAYVLSKISPKEGITLYGDGMRARFIAAYSNTGASTVNVNGLGVKDIKKFNGSTYIALEADDIPAGYEVLLSFRDSADLFELVGFVEEATETRRGIIQIATQAEVLAATNKDKAVVPGYMIDHPGIAKVVASWDDAGNENTNHSYNVASITKIAGPRYTITFDVTFVDNLFVVSGLPGPFSGGECTMHISTDTPPTTTSVTISIYDWAAINLVSSAGKIAVFGKLA